jgi:glucose/arabinose dehydrogenase
MRTVFTRGVGLALLIPLLGCKGSTASMVMSTPDATMSGNGDAHFTIDSDIPDVRRPEAPVATGDYCSLPGSVVWQNGSPSVVPGGPMTSPDLTWMTLPDGFCSHFYATVPETRQLRFSPSGDLFVASPSQSAAGGASGGVGAILILPDDNQDGLAESPVTYMGDLPITQGMLFYNGDFYYQNGTTIQKTPYANGDRAPTGPSTRVIDITVYQSSDHWSKVLDVDDNGNIYVTNGGDNGEVCEPGEPAELGTDRPFHGGILLVNGTTEGQEVAKGTRNPIAIRCARGTGMCFGLELALDFSAEEGSREKLFPIRQGDDWGFPCCATADTPYSQYTDPVPDCSGVAAEEDSFIIDHTPFGLDFEEGAWPGTWKYRAFIVLHGEFGTWVGARIVGIQTDARTGWPASSAEADAGTTMLDFATGWDDGMEDHGRPANIAFSPDGRMFVGNDINGMIFWVAPVGG